jgi:hypothetical protein
VQTISFIYASERLLNPASRTVQPAWYNLAFTAGLINAGGFLAWRRFVSYVAGFVTLSGVDFARNSWWLEISIGGKF